MQRILRMVSVAVLVLGFATIGGTAANAGIRCCSAGSCCTPSSGTCCATDGSGCYTYSCKPAV